MVVVVVGVVAVVVEVVVVGMVEVVAVVVAGVVVLGVVGVGVVMVMVRLVGSGGGRNGNDRSGTTTTFPLLSLSRLEGSLCLEGASFQLGAPSLCKLSTLVRSKWSAPYKPICP